MNKKCLFAVVIVLVSLICLSACGALRDTADKNKALNESLPYYELNAANYDEISYNGLTYTITDECLEMSELQEEIGQVSKCFKNVAGGDFLTHLLVVDDEVSILELIKNSLGKDGYLITVCQNADDVDIKKLHFYDLILLDVMMPGTDGFEFCKQIRNMVDCPILFLTAKTLEEDILFGLGIGADDYITKPFRIQELRARVAAHLRREKREHHSTLSFEPDIRFDLSAKVLYVSEQPVPLTKSEYSICEYLAKNRGQVFTKEQIYEAVFGFDGIGDNSTISTHIKNIRAKLEHFKISPISTLWGIGYKWE